MEESSINFIVTDYDVREMNSPANQEKHTIVAFEEKSEFDSLCDAFRRRDDALSLIFQLNQLIKAVQKHRGMTMALIGGNKGFRKDFEEQQYQLDRRIATLQAFIRRTGNLISNNQEDGICLAWQTIRQDWQDDKLSDNFELHSHFIEQLQGIVVSLAKELEKPLEGVSSSDPHDYPQVFKQIELLNFVAKELPEMIEQLAKVRGLSTYIAASGEVEYHHDRKLRYVLQCAKQQNEKLRHQSERLRTILNGSVASLTEIKTVELKLIYLMETVENDVLGGGTIKTNSHQLFKLATELIDVYWFVLNEGLTVVRRWHEDLLESWLKLGSTQVIIDYSA